jgi:hypothetical protein
MNMPKVETKAMSCKLMPVILWRKFGSLAKLKGQKTLDALIEAINLYIAKNE